MKKLFSDEYKHCSCNFVLSNRAYCQFYHKGRMHNNKKERKKKRLEQEDINGSVFSATISVIPSRSASQLIHPVGNNCLRSQCRILQGPGKRYSRKNFVDSIDPFMPPGFIMTCTLTSKTSLFMLTGFVRPEPLAFS